MQEYEKSIYTKIKQTNKNYEGVITLLSFVLNAMLNCFSYLID